jgi:hypothetical protein
MISASGNNQNFTGTGWKEREASQKPMEKNPETFRLKYCFYVSIDFRCFPSGTGAYFLTWV